MATRIVMPTFGMYTAEGTFGRWLVSPGARVEAGDLIAEITTEKASYEIEAPAGGVVHPVARPGDPLTVEGLIGWVLEEGEGVPRIAEGEPDAEGRGQAPPLRPERIAARDARLATSRPSPAVPLTRPMEVPGVGAGLDPALSSSGMEDEEPVPVHGLPGPAATPTAGYLRLKASPAARRLAAERGVDIETVTGSGPAGRIVEADVLAAAARARSVTTSSARPAPSVPWRVQQRIPLTGIRGAVARRLREAQATAVALTLTREVHADVLVAARERLCARLGPISWDAVFVKLFGDALRVRPELNAVVLDEEIVVFDQVHVGFAVPLPGGLVAPVVDDVDARPLAEVAAAVRILVERARAGTLTPADLIGTATVSNLGAEGVDAFTPVLNPPQSAILGIGRIASRPRVEGERLLAGTSCVLSLTFDHRVADGAPAARLLAEVAARMGDAAYLDSLAVESRRR